MSNPFRKDALFTVAALILLYFLIKAANPTIHNANTWTDFLHDARDFKPALEQLDSLDLVGPVKWHRLGLNSRHDGLVFYARVLTQAPPEFNEIYGYKHALSIKQVGRFPINPDLLATSYQFNKLKYSFIIYIFDNKDAIIRIEQLGAD